MSTQTKTQLLNAANQIKNETTPFANTATRVGEMLVNIIDSFGVLVPFKKELSNANLLAEAAYDIDELGAPGAGYAWVIVEASARLSGAGTPFDGAPAIRIVADGTTRGQIDDSTATLAAGNDLFAPLPIVTTLIDPNTLIVENKKIQVYISDDSTAGDGTLTVYGLARLITL